MQPVKLIGLAASTAAHTIRHPISSAAYVAGIARGLAGAAIHGTLVDGHDPDAGPPPIVTQRTGSPGEAPGRPREPQRVPKPVPPPDAEFDTIVIESADEAPGEAFATEPKAVSRESDHGGGTATDAEIDAWIDEAMSGSGEIETPAGTSSSDGGSKPDFVEAELQRPVLDPATAKAILKESEIMRKAAERDPE